MSFSPSSRQVVLCEVFDENSQPSEEEIREYAVRIGVDIENEGNLLPLARECLMQPLPIEWKPCYDEDCPDKIYYFNFQTNRAQWEHPLEELHRSLVKKTCESTSSVDQFDEDSRTTAKEDLKSYEEAPKSESQPSEAMHNMNITKKLEPLSSFMLKASPLKPTAQLGPLRVPTSLDDSKKSIENTVKIRPNSSDIRNRRNTGHVELRQLSKQEVITPKSALRDEGYGTESSTTEARRGKFEALGKELTLAGGGTMFLKKSAKKLDVDLSPKGILRKDSLGDGDLDLLKSLTKEEIEDDRKSVRFNLEKEIKVGFEIPSSNESDENSSRPSSAGVLLPTDSKKEIAVDFEDLINSANHMKVPDNANIQAKDEAVSSRNYKKSIQIVLNPKETNKNGNLIDLTDGESISMIDSHETEIGGKDLSDIMFPKKIIVALDGKSEKACLKAKQSLDDLWKLSESDTSSQSNGDKLVVNGVLELDNVEKVRNNLDVARADKLKDLEGEYNAWVQSTEKMYKEKERQHNARMKEKFDDWKKNQENESIKDLSQQFAEESQSRIKELKNKLVKEEQEAVEALKNELAMQQKERLRALRQEVEANEEKELAALKQSLEASLSEKKKELYKKHQDELGRLDRSMETLLAEQRAQHQLELEKAREEESALHAMRAEIKDAFLHQKTVLQQEHEMALQKLRQQHETEQRQLAASLRVATDDVTRQDDSTRKSQAVEKESSDPRVYEKLRCEKRLLEDKYKSLKEKYIRLKTDVKLSLEKKTKRKEAPISASETDKSGSQKTNKPENGSPNVRRNGEVKTKKQAINLDNVNQNVSNGNGVAHLGDAEDSSGEDENIVAARRRRQLFSRLKAASTSRLSSTTRLQEKDDALSPVENLRRQLKKLEELEDEFPVTPHTDTYLRYPFSDAPAPHFACSEIEFFKHRIHLERDSVRRAKEFLKTQKKCYEKRQLELQHRLLNGGPTSKSILDQIHKEERELTEMEVSVHRTRALLGEKIIRLRHLEQSLRRVAPERRPRTVSREDGTLSDLSSHSDSSGFSSTHHASDPFPVGPRPNTDLSRRHLQTSMQESSEIIQSLENLNTEIRGIWEVLKQQSSGPGAVLLPPPPLAWPAVRANPTADPNLRPLTQQMMTAVSNVGHVTTTVVDSSLVDRTRSLRDWLKSARRSPNLDQSAAQQVTL